MQKVFIAILNCLQVDKTVSVVVAAAVFGANPWWFPLLLSRRHNVLDPVNDAPQTLGK